ncbi:hypothetical protein SBA5_380034 [Candidatus Sulfotelmatomonas gaucii]|uniref:Uncharacterized protein n=1 Tax=Candidatus Sulfuritelmatomonas gaucii TaxID=2043161 RepID=A0A2N9LJH0_9BACT|nr:hypothetical protein SBA5_380034 [Candidatus Sulfotelmatomonas gaucii]
MLLSQVIAFDPELYNDTSLNQLTLRALSLGDPARVDRLISYWFFEGTFQCLNRTQLNRRSKLPTLKLTRFTAASKSRSPGTTAKAALHNASSNESKSSKYSLPRQSPFWPGKTTHTTN